MKLATEIIRGVGLVLFGFLLADLIGIDPPRDTVETEPKEAIVRDEDSGYWVEASIETAPSTRVYAKQLEHEYGKRSL